MSILDSFFSTNIFKDRISKNLYLVGIGGRICYSEKDIISIINKNIDKQLVSSENLLNYVCKMIKYKHLSVLEHCVIPITKQEVIYFIKDNNILIYDLIKEIDENIQIMFEMINSFLEQGYPIYDNVIAQKMNKQLNDIIINGNSREINGFYKLFCLLLRSKFDILSYTDDTIYLNLRHYIEYLLSVYNNADTVANYFRTFIEDTFKEYYSLEMLSPIKIIKNKNENTVLYIMKIYLDKNKVNGITYIIENCSRSLTHQLVRHRLYSSYSQRSLRYTKIKDSNSFIIPHIKYIGDVRSKKYKNIIDIYENTYNTCADTYSILLDENVKKEDARFVLPIGVNTTIMVTMIDKGLKNFLTLRTQDKTQWEIKYIAEKIKDFINKA